MKLVLVGIIATVSLMLGACSSEDASKPTVDKASEQTQAQGNVETDDEDQDGKGRIIDHLGLAEGEEEGWIYDANGTECKISVVLADPKMVGIYAEGGDNVAINPTKTAGVKLFTTEAAAVETCMAALTEGLSDLR